MKPILLTSIMFLSVLTSSIFLSSCSLDQKAGSDTTSGYQQYNGKGQNENRGGRGRFGSGGMRGGSGMNSMMNQIAPEDRALFQQIMEARQSGNAELTLQLENQLKQKYPNIRFGSGARMSGSGAMMMRVSHTGASMNSTGTIN